jgi:AcrR family transcriptional regulator
MPSEKLRQRVLQEAGDLFYAEGINATGVNRVAEVLGISKRTLYELFDTKDELITASLAARDLPVREALTAAAETATSDPALRLVAVFSALEHWLTQPDFRGCPFLNSAAELADASHPARRVTAEHKEALRAWLEQQARAARLSRPKRLSQQLMLVFDGALAHAAAAPDAPNVAADTARALVDSARR